MRRGFSLDLRWRRSRAAQDVTLRVTVALLLATSQGLWMGSLSDKKVRLHPGGHFDS